MKRNIIEINESLCIGCGLCANACHQGAIVIVNGKAKLTSEAYCDGLGKCLPSCPVGAIEVVEKETDQFDENRRDYAVKQNSTKATGGSCKSVAPRVLNQKITGVNEQRVASQLKQWPVQIALINSGVDFLENADILICADCVPFAYPNLHNDYMKDRVVLVGCPKLDNINAYYEKFEEIFKNRNIKSVTVLRMEVPCCGGITRMAQKALLASGKQIPYTEIVVGIEGGIK